LAHQALRQPEIAFALRTIFRRTANNLHIGRAGLANLPYQIRMQRPHTRHDDDALIVRDARVVVRVACAGQDKTCGTRWLTRMLESRNHCAPER